MNRRQPRARKLQADAACAVDAEEAPFVHDDIAYELAPHMVLEQDLISSRDESYVLDCQHLPNVDTSRGSGQSRASGLWLAMACGLACPRASLSQVKPSLSPRLSSQAGPGKSLVAADSNLALPRAYAWNLWVQ